jgi:hypothetical protein
MAGFLKGIIDRQEGDFLVIKITGDQEIYWPKKEIDWQYQVGETVNVFLSKNEPASVEDKAKVILRQIFQPNV